MLAALLHPFQHPMELRHLRYFLAVAEELNFTRAAERLHIAQPPLSTQMRALEEELGADLFVRDKRRVYLTQAGQEFLEHTRRILGATQEAKLAALQAATGSIGRLALGYTASAMFSERLPALIREFRARQPHVRLSLSELSSVDQVAALHDRRLDVGVLRRPDMDFPANITVELWHQTPLIAAIPERHPLAAREQIRIGELRDQPIISYPRDAGIGLYWPFIKLCQKAGFQPLIVQEARESSVIVGLVAAGVGIAVVPEPTRHIQLPGVSYRRIQGREAHSALYLAYRNDDPSPHARALLAVLRAKAPKTPAPGA